MKRLKSSLPYGCHYCDWRFEEKIQLKLHKFWHRDEICCWCGLSFLKDTQLREHLIKYHDKKRRRCRCYTIWDRTMRRCESSREKHMCPTCGDSYELFSEGKHDSCMRAIRRRTRKCCFCFATHVTLASLNRHKSIFHPRGRRLVCFECKYCTKMMADFQSFRQHVFRHEKKYMCYWLKPETWSFKVLKEDEFV